MPRNNSKQRVNERKERAAVREQCATLAISEHPNLRVIGMVGTVTAHVAEDPEMRRCAECTLRKWECNLLSSEAIGFERHEFRPMPVEQQLKFEDEEYAMRHSHFSGHKPDCTLVPEVCYITCGGI